MVLNVGLRIVIHGLGIVRGSTVPPCLHQFPLPRIDACDSLPVNAQAIRVCPGRGEDCKHHHRLHHLELQLLGYRSCSHQHLLMYYNSKYVAVRLHRFEQQGFLPFLETWYIGRNVNLGVGRMVL
jgi:hypothetical protein